MNVRFFTVFLLSFIIFFSPVFGQEDKSNAEVWTGTWATAPQLVEPNNMPPAPGLANNTIRQIIRVSIGGETVRLHFTNIFSSNPVTMKEVTIAVAKDSCAIDKVTLKKLKFDGKTEITMAPGKDVMSDPIKFNLALGSRLAITIAYGETSKDVTGHPGSRTTSYIVTGDKVTAPNFANAVKTDHWYNISGLDVVTSSDAAAIAVLGNSITDGRGSGTNKQNRWTDILSEKLLNNSTTNNIGVLNLGIGGNCIVRGGLGPTALNRFDRDILSQSNVRWMIILEGVNDIGGVPNAEIAPKVAEDLINAYKAMIDKAHAKGLKVYGATIMPFAKSFYDKDYRLAVRDLVNSWIRSTKFFDAVIDMDALMRDPKNPEAMQFDMQDNDYLHPNQVGHKKIGESVDLNLFK